MRTELLFSCLLPALLVSGAALADAVVTQKGRAFRPAQVSIARGEAVTFTNQDSFIHQVYAAGVFESGEQAPGENINQVFTATGTFPVRCRIHPTMKMTVLVR